MNRAVNSLFSLTGVQLGIEGPILDRHKRLDLAFPFNDEAQSYGLHPARGQAAAHLVPQQRRDLITHDAIEDASRLLCVDKIAIDIPGMFKGVVHRLGGNFIKRYATNRVALGETAQLIFKMRCDRFSFTVRVRSEINNSRSLGQLLQPVDDLFLSRG